MSTTVTINGTDYEVPVQGQDPNWGADVHDTLVALSTAVASLSGSADIPLTSFTLANNQSSVANITSVAFNTATVRSFILQYSVYRSTSTTEESEVGTLYGTYKTTAATWDLSQQYGGSSGITFSITAGGQVQYVSTSLGGTGYSGKLKIKGVSFLQA